MPVLFAQTTWQVLTSSSEFFQLTWYTDSSNGGSEHL